MNIAVVDDPELNVKKEVESKGLKRIAMSDSFLGKLNTKIDVNGSVHFSGHNGEGKTSALMLIHVFLGIRPDKVVDTKKGTFLSYCLPTHRSYIAFEYRREDGLCTVVVFANRNRNGVCYRFIKGSLDDTIQHEAFAELLAETSSVQETLKKLSTDTRFEMSVQIESSSEYEAVLCNQKSRLARKHNLLSEMARFSLCGAEHQLKHLAEISFACGEKEGLHSKLTRMITSIFNVDQMGVATPPKDHQMPELLASIKTMSRFRQNGDKFQKGIELGELTRNLYADLMFYRDKASDLQLDYKQQIRVLQNRAADQHSKHKAVKGDLEQKSSNIHEQYLLADSSLKVVERQLEEIAKQEKNYADMGIEDKRHEYNNLANLKTNVEVTEKHLNHLSDQNKDAENAYLRSKDELANDIQRQVAQLQAQKKRIWKGIDELRAARQEAENRINTEIEKELAEKRLVMASELRVIQSEIEQLSMELGQSCYPTTEEQDEVDQYAKRIVEAQKALDQVRQALAQLNESRESCMREHYQAKADYEALDRRIQSAKDLLSHYQSILSPKGTVLGVLRKKLHGNEFRSAITLIDKDLLQRTDVNFEVVEDSTTFFGLDFDLSNVDLPLEARSDEDLTVKIEDQVTLIADLEQQLQVQKKKIEQCQLALDKVMQQIGRERIGVAKAEEALEQVKYVAGECDRKVKAQIEVRKAEVQAKVNAAKMRQEDQLKINLKKEKEVIHKGKERKSTLASDMDGKINQLTLNDQRLDADIEAVEASQKDREKQLVDRYHAQLQERGIDVAVLSAAQQAFDNAKAEFNRVNGYAIQIQQYENWLSTVLVGRQGLVGQQQELIQKISEYNAQSAQLKRQISELIALYKGEQQALEVQIMETRQREAALGVFIDNAARNINDVLPVEASKIEFQNYELFIQAADSTLVDYRRNLTELSRLVQSVNSVVNQERESQLYHEWEKLKAQHVEHCDKPHYCLLVIADLNMMLKEMVPLAERNARSTFSSICQRVIAYFDSLREFKNKVAHVSRKLSNELVVDNPVPNITDISLNLKTVIDETTPLYMKMKTLKARFEESPVSTVLESEEVVHLPDDALMNLLSSTMNDIHGANYGSKNKNDLVYLSIDLKENGNPILLNNDESYKHISSTGISRLVIIMIFTALARYMNRDPDLKIHIPFDELGVIDVPKIIGLFGMLQARNIHMACAQPDLNAHVVDCFSYRYLVCRDVGLKQFNPKAAKRRQNPLLAKAAV